MLVVQMFRLMDRILKADGLDLKFTLYSVLATSTTEGFVQFIKATPLRNVVTQFGSIQVRACMCRHMFVFVAQNFHRLSKFLNVGKLLLC